MHPDHTKKNIIIFTFVRQLNNTRLLNASVELTRKLINGLFILQSMLQFSRQFFEIILTYRKYFVHGFTVLYLIAKIFRSIVETTNFWAHRSVKWEIFTYQ